MHHVAPNHDGIAPRFDQPSRLARRMPRLGESGHAGTHRTVANGADAIRIGRGREPRALEELECLRRRAARRIRIAEELQIRLVHHEFRLREDGLPMLIDEPVHVVGMKMRHQDRVDVFRLDPHGSQIAGEHSKRRAHTDPATRVDQHPPAGDLDEESVHRHLWRNGSEGRRLEPLAFRMVDPDDEIERGLERPVIDRGHESVANHEMMEPGRLAAREFDRFTHQESLVFLPIAYVQVPKVRRLPVVKSRSRLGSKRPLPILGARIDAIESLIGTGPSQMARRPKGTPLLPRRGARAPSDAKKTEGTCSLNPIGTPDAPATRLLWRCAPYARLAFCRAKTSWPSRSRIRTPIV